jgi:hypothetical protein
MTRPSASTIQSRRALANYRALEKLKALAKVKDGDLVDLQQEGLERARQIWGLLFQAVFKQDEKPVQIGYKLLKCFKF